MADICFLDLETQSDVDLPLRGLRLYAMHASTAIITMGYTFDEERTKVWWPRERSFPQSVIDHITSGKPIWAHNAQFEQHLFEWVIANDFGIEPPRPTQWRCSMALALASNFRGGLDAVAASLGLTHRKHPQGRRLIADYCAPGHMTAWLPGDRELMELYVKEDVETMRELVKCLRPLSAGEWAEYHLNTRINDRGLPIDIKFCRGALSYIDQMVAGAAEEITLLTGGKMVKHTERKARDAWILPKLTEYQRKLLVVHKKGVRKVSFDIDHREHLLACDDLDPDARQLLELINEGGSSALQKYAVAVHQEVDGLVHNTFLWHGASATGRFAGKGLQPHNFRRDCYDNEDVTVYLDHIEHGFELKHPSVTLARLLRAMIYHKDGLYWVDWKAIEGRVAPWLANSHIADKKLDLYRENRDVYVVTAAQMFGYAENEINDNQRQGGKVCELSLQFGGGYNALINMARNYGLALDEPTARDYVTKWRHINPWAQITWADYDRAIETAVQSPGTAFSTRRVKFYSDGKNFLWCQLPSGRLLSYPKPKWELYETPWGEERIGPTFQIAIPPPAGEPPLRNHLRGALVFQNTVQGVAADLLRESLVEADKEGLDIRLHCHDEIMGVGSRAAGELLNEIMLENLWWCPDLPLATGGVVTGNRYGKKG